MATKEDYISVLKTISAEMIVPFVVSELGARVTNIRAGNAAIQVEVKDNKEDSLEYIEQTTKLITNIIEDTQIFLRAFLEFSESKT